MIDNDHHQGKKDMSPISIKIGKHKIHHKSLKKRYQPRIQDFSIDKVYHESIKNNSPIKNKRLRIR